MNEETNKEFEELSKIHKDKFFHDAELAGFTPDQANFLYKTCVNTMMNTIFPSLF